MGNKEEIDKCIANINRIPKVVRTDVVEQIDVKELVKKIEAEMKKQNRRYNSYV